MSSNNEQRARSEGTTQKLSKRQRRALGSNPSTSWQQAPRIKSAGARAKAYLNYAGLADTNNNKNQSTIEQLLNPDISLHSPEVKFGKLLGGTDERSRHGAVKMLREYLRARSDFTNGGIGLSELDLLKLWKGLWYTLYMADKTPVQNKLSKLLAELMWCLSGTEEEDEYAGQVYLQMDTMDNDGEGVWDDENEEGEGEGMSDDENVPVIGVDPQAERELFGNDVVEDDEGDTMEIIDMDDSDEENNNDMEDSEEVDDEDEDEERIKAMNESHCRGAHLVSLYVSTFLRTVRREWGNVDKHRVDKFYTAVRYMISEAYKYMAKRHWNIGIIRLFNDVIYTEALAADTPGLTNGLRYHLIDICVDELAKVNAEADLQLTEATFLDALEPFFGVSKNADDKNVQKRVMDNVLLKFLNEYSVVSEMALDEEADDDDKALIFNQVHVGSVSDFIFQIASDPDTDERYRKSLYDMHKTYVRQVRVAGTDVDINQYPMDEDDNEEEDEGDDNDTGNMDDDGKDDKKDIEDEKTLTASSEKKKKSKKKKSKKKDVKEVVEEHSADAVEEKSSTPKTKPSKKKRKQKDNETEDAAPETPKTKADESTPKSSKSSKKKRKKQHDSEPSGEDLITSHVETPKPSSKKKKKKKKEKSPPSVDPRSMLSPDHQGASPENSDNEDDTDAFAVSKRVSFGKMNHCKSHKASIKAIKNLDKERWDTASRTPDKGILRPKGSSAVKSSEKKSSRKKKSKK